MVNENNIINITVLTIIGISKYFIVNLAIIIYNNVAKHRSFVQLYCFGYKQ